VKKCVVGAGPSADGWPPGGPPLGPLDPYHSKRRFDSARGPERQPQGREESLSASIRLRAHFARAALPPDLRKGFACAQVGPNLVRAALPPDFRKGSACAQVGPNLVRAALPPDLRKGSACAQVGPNLARAALPPDLRKGFAFPEADSITYIYSNRGCASAEPPPWSQSVRTTRASSSPP